MGDQIVAVLNSWLDIFGNMEKNGQEVVSAAENLVGKVDSIPDKIKMTQNEVCVGEACSQEQVVSFMAKGKCIVSESYYSTYLVFANF